jgi:hypothetical protein
VIKVREIAAKVDAVTGDDERDGEIALGASVHGEVIEDAQMYGTEKLDHRIMVANSNTKNLNERVEKLRQKVAMLGGKELSAKERAFAEEVSRLEASLEREPSQLSEVPAPVSSTHTQQPVKQWSPTLKEGRRHSDRSLRRNRRLAGTACQASQPGRRALGRAGRAGKETGWRRCGCGVQKATLAAGHGFAGP